MDTRIYEPVSGGKTTVFYFEIADGMDINYGFSLDIDPESDPVIYSDEELTNPVEKEEFMDAYRSGAVVMSCFTSSVALGDIQRYFVVGGITEGKNEGVENYVRVFVSPLDIPAPAAPSVGTAYAMSTESVETENDVFYPLAKVNLSTEEVVYMTSSEVEELLKKDIIKIFFPMPEEYGIYIRYFVNSVYIKGLSRLQFPLAVITDIDYIPETEGDKTIFVCAQEDIPSQTEPQGST